MSRNQKIILGGVIIVFVVGIGLGLQYVSKNNFRGKNNRAMNFVTTDEGSGTMKSRMNREHPNSVADQGVTIENKAQAEQALLEIEGSFGEIEAESNVNE